MTTPLYPYQEVGADFLAARKAAYLADDPGVGKSAQAVAACDRVQAARILVVCPASLKVKWGREFTKFSDTNRPQVIPTKRDWVPHRGPLVCMVNFEIVIDPGLHWLLREGDWDVIVVDEGHKLKSPDTKVTRAMLGMIGLHHYARHVWPLSGTPMPNHAGEIYPYLAAIYPRACRGKDYATWLRHYCQVVEGTYGLKVMGHKHTIADLRDDLQDFMLRRRRSEVLPDMPELRITDLTVENDAALAAIEKAMAGEELEAVDSRLQAMLGEDVSDDALDELEETAMATLRRLCGEAKAQALVPVIKDELEGGVDKIVLMCWHRATMDILQQGLAEYGVARVDGSTKDRQAEVDRFQAGHAGTYVHAQTTTNCGTGVDSAAGGLDTTTCRVFVGQIQAAGTGNDLTAACDLIIVEPSWVPGDNVQAMLRIHRIGQARGCLVRFARLAGSIDEAIMAVAQRKAQLVAELL